MAKHVIWSERSLVLLQEIIKYWNKRNGSVKYTEKLYGLIQSALLQLSQFPEIGSDTENSKIQYTKVRTYYIYYSYDDTTLNVIAISHVRRGPKYLKSIMV